MTCTKEQEEKAEVSVQRYITALPPCMLCVCVCVCDNMGMHILSYTCIRMCLIQLSSKTRVLVLYDRSK